MNTLLKHHIEVALQIALDEHCEEHLWSGWIHDELVIQMATAAEQVFDSAMKAQTFAKEQSLT